MGFREGLSRLAALGGDFAREQGLDTLTAGEAAGVEGGFESLVGGISDRGFLAPSGGGFQDPGARGRTALREFRGALTGSENLAPGAFKLGDGTLIRQRPDGTFTRFSRVVIGAPGTAGIDPTEAGIQPGDAEISTRDPAELSGEQLKEAQGLADTRNRRLALLDPGTVRGARTLAALGRVARAGGSQTDLLEAFSQAQQATPQELREQEREEAVELRERERVERGAIRERERTEDREQRQREREAEREFTRERDTAQREFQEAMRRAQRFESQGKREEADAEQRRAQVNRLSSQIILQSQDRAARARAALPTGGATAQEVQRLEQLATAKAQSVRARRDFLFADPTRAFDPFSFQLGSDEDFFGLGNVPAGLARAAAPAEPAAPDPLATASSLSGLAEQELLDVVLGSAVSGGPGVTFEGGLPVSRGRADVGQGDVEANLKQLLSRSIGRATSEPVPAEALANRLSLIAGGPLLRDILATAGGGEEIAPDIDVRRAEIIQRLEEVVRRAAAEQGITRAEFNERGGLPFDPEQLLDALLARELVRRGATGQPPPERSTFRVRAEPDVRGSAVQELAGPGPVPSPR